MNLTMGSKGRYAPLSPSVQRPLSLDFLITEGRVLAELGSSWGKRLSFRLNAYFRP